MNNIPVVSFEIRTLASHEENRMLVGDDFRVDVTYYCDYPIEKALEILSNSTIDLKDAHKKARVVNLKPTCKPLNLILTSASQSKIDGYSQDREKGCDRGTAMSSLKDFLKGLKKDPLVEKIEKTEKSEELVLIIEEICTCPISGKQMIKPVIIETGYSFEEEALVDYFKKNSNCPLSKQKISSQVYFVNYALKDFIDSFREEKAKEKNIHFLELQGLESPISLELFKNPVVVSTGRTYDSHEVGKINDDPINREPLDPSIKFANKALQALIQVIKKLMK